MTKQERTEERIRKLIRLGVSDTAADVVARGSPEDAKAIAQYRNAIASHVMEAVRAGGIGFRSKGADDATS